MSEPFIGEIRMFAGNFAPRSWAFCDGQLLAVSQNNALFALLGTTFGGDGETTFGLPELRGRLAVHPGTGPGLSDVRWGERAGSETVTLTPNQLPSHNHALAASSAPGVQDSPQGQLPASSPSLDLFIQDTPDTNLAAASIGNAGGSQSHNNVAPFLCINYIIALVGIFPSRN